MKEKLAEKLHMAMEGKNWRTKQITHLSTNSFASFLLEVVSSSDFDKNMMTCPRTK